MSEDVKVEQSTGNVFKDVGFSDAEAERALLKADLAIEIYNIIEAQKLTQAKAGKILGIDPSDISRLKQGDFNRFSVERLFTLLNRFNRNIEIRITPAEDSGGTSAGCCGLGSLNQIIYGTEGLSDILGLGVRKSLFCGEGGAICENKRCF